ncbi:MAG: hypothetical protein GY820_21880, partial [Gammaproteobacteria bacterium]|nr:hypothetical protein [Gammaproteobacteria bacterium]
MVTRSQSRVARNNILVSPPKIAPEIHSEKVKDNLKLEGDRAEMDRTNNQLREAQLKDLELKTIIDLLENSPQTKRVKGLIGYRMEDNVLYYADDNGENRRIVVPVQERQKICWEHHYGPTGGHFGWKKTSLSLKSRYFWPFMSGKIKSYVRSCEICAAHNGNQRRCKP